MARDFVGDSMIELSVRLTGSCDGSASFSSLSVEPQNVELTGGYSAAATLIWSGGGPGELVLFSMSASGSRTRLQGDPNIHESSRSITFVHRTLRDIADPAANIMALTVYDGANSVDEVTPGDYYETASGVTLSHLVAGNAVEEITGSSGPASIGIPFPDETWVLMTSQVNDAIEESSSTIDFAGLRALSSTWALRVNAFQGAVPSDPIIAQGGLPAANTSTGRGLQTSAQDTRGNWLMTAEIASFGTADMSWPGSISGSGTYTTQAGGPDALTPSLVATLTGYAPHDRWDVGAF
jgi:hypothetical protein